MTLKTRWIYTKGVSEPANLQTQQKRVEWSVSLHSVTVFGSSRANNGASQKQHMCLMELSHRYVGMYLECAPFFGSCC